MSMQLAEMLVKDKIISQAQFTEAAQAASRGKGYVRFLIEKKYIAETKLLAYLSHKFGLPSINITKFEVGPNIIRLVPVDFAKKNQLIPIQSNQGTLVVVMCDPINVPSLESLKFITKMNVEAVLTSYSAFDAAMAKYYSGAASVGEAIQTYEKDSKNQGASSGGGIELVSIHEIDSQSSDQDAPVIQLVNGLLSECIRRGASDIHVEPYEKRCRVRMRIDGVLHEVAEIPLAMKRAITARFKIMSQMDIAESRLPQDGRIKLKSNGAVIDFRVNSLPSLFGEKIVLRMLSQGNLQLDMMKLGFEAKQLETFKKGIYSSSGLVLVTGPTGSGKTTTLYSAISELNQVTDNISTAEDPVEYNLEGVNQVQVHKEIGMTFAAILRALLRQDPDIVLVGEIRDMETAEIAIQAALTGHLVLSTLHTNDAPSTITRLINMGVQPFLVVAAINTIIAQRLVRSICAHCKIEETIPVEKLIEGGFSKDDAKKVKCYKGKGCSKCNNSGYKGRLAIYEVFDFNMKLKEMILKGANQIELKRQAVQDGMKSLRLSALTKVVEGKTTFEEALAVSMEN